MTYSAGMFKKESDDLYDAQLNKYLNLAKITNIKNKDKVLEVGCGWGSFFVFFSQKFLADVTAITISKKQYESKENSFKEKLTDKVRC